MVRIVEESREFEIRCPDCLRRLAYKIDDIHDLYVTDYTGSTDKLGRGIVCPLCAELLVIDPFLEELNEDH